MTRKELNRIKPQVEEFVNCLNSQARSWREHTYEVEVTKSIRNYYTISIKSDLFYSSDMSSFMAFISEQHVAAYISAHDDIAYMVLDKY